MGGSFDPIHVGHLRAAESARVALGLERVVFMPAGLPPHRAGAAAGAHDRLVMAELATASHPRFVCSALEVRREGRSYTVDTLAELLREAPGTEWTLILGTDAYAELATWKEPDRLLGMCRLAVVDRPGWVRPSSGPPAAEVPSSELLVSSTWIRAELKEGRSVRYLVPEPVVDYICKRGLYR